MSRHRVIDLRSDTVTQPTRAMREAMARADVGDDVFGEDPTVNALQDRAAELMGKEAALLVASGTMGNLLAHMVHGRPGDEAIVGDKAHTFHYEGGGMAAVAGVQPRTVPNRPDGTIAAASVEEAVRPAFETFPRTSIVCLENTHNVCDGAALDATATAAVAEVARRHGLKVHLDGARLFNAAVALGVPPHRLTRDVDSVTFCLSKGLSAPVGSVLCGSTEFVASARRARKMIGGGMRQAGVIAAAGLVALDEMPDRLREDHRLARMLAVGLADVTGLAVAPERVQTNIVYIGLADGTDTEVLVRALAGSDIRILPAGPQRLRAVTHQPQDDADIGQVIRAFRQALSG